MLTHHPNVTTLTKQAQAKLQWELIQDSVKPVLFLSSGGSAFSLLNSIRFSFPSHLTISVLDDRWSIDPGISNFAQLTTTDFFVQAKRAGATFFDTRPLPGETPEVTGQRFHRFLQDWRQQHPEGKIIATMGIGVDGHTAGIFPEPDLDLFNKQFFNPSVWAVVYDVGSKNPYSLRVTVTASFLITQVDYALVYVVGEEKQPVLKKYPLGPR